MPGFNPLFRDPLHRWKAQDGKHIFTFKFMHEFVASCPSYPAPHTRRPCFSPPWIRSICIAHAPDSPSRLQPCSRVKIMNPNKSLVLSHAHQANLDVVARWRRFLFFSRLIPRDWPELRRVLPIILINVTAYASHAPSL